MGMSLSSNYIASASQIAENVTNRLIYETTLTSDVTSIDVTGLDLDADKKYIIELNAYGLDNIDLSMYINGDTTATNYYSEELTANAAAVSATRYNTAKISAMNTNNSCTFSGILMEGVDGYAYLIGQATVGRGSGIANRCYAYSSSAALAANLTQLTFTSSVANKLGTGTVLRIYRT